MFLSPRQTCTQIIQAICHRLSWSKQHTSLLVQFATVSNYSFIWISNYTHYLPIYKSKHTSLYFHHRPFSHNRHSVSEESVDGCQECIALLSIDCTSISSLYFRRGASIIFLNLKVSLPTSRLCPVRAVILCQCLSIMALLAMCSNSGQHSLKSSMVFFKSRKACQSFRARGSFRHLWEKPTGKTIELFKTQTQRIKNSLLTFPPKTISSNTISFLKFQDSEAIYWHILQKKKSFSKSEIFLQSFMTIA